MVLVEALTAAESDGALASVLVSEEKVATGAADGYARIARRPGATLLHLGPGLANGLSNLHNARRGGTPIVNLIGDMSTWHASADPPLAMDIASLGGSVGSVVASLSAKEVYADCTRCSREAAAPAPPGVSRVRTLLLPHDATREPTDIAEARAAAEVEPPLPTLLTDAEMASVDRAAKLLREHGARACVFAGGDALVRRSEGGGLAFLGGTSV